MADPGEGSSRRFKMALRSPSHGSSKRISQETEVPLSAPLQTIGETAEEATDEDIDVSHLRRISSSLTPDSMTLRASSLDFSFNRVYQIPTTETENAREDSSTGKGKVREILSSPFNNITEAGEEDDNEVGLSDRNNSSPSSRIPRLGQGNLVGIFL